MLISVPLRIARPAKIDGTVVSGPVAHIRFNDIEEGLVPGAEKAVGEIVRMRIAALARIGIDRLNLIRTHLVKPLRRAGDDIGFAHSGFQLFEYLIINAIDHGRRLVQQHDFIDVLDLALIQHGLLRVAHLQPERL